MPNTTRNIFNILRSFILISPTVKNNDYDMQKMGFIEN